MEKHTSDASANCTRSGRIIAFRFYFKIFLFFLALEKVNIPGQGSALVLDSRLKIPEWRYINLIYRLRVEARNVMGILAFFYYFLIPYHRPSQSVFLYLAFTALLEPDNYEFSKNIMAITKL